VGCGKNRSAACWQRFPNAVNWGFRQLGRIVGRDLQGIRSCGNKPLWERIPCRSGSGPIGGGWHHHRVARSSLTIWLWSKWHLTVNHGGVRDPCIVWVHRALSFWSNCYLDRGGRPLASADGFAQSSRFNVAHPHGSGSFWSFGFMWPSY